MWAMVDLRPISHACLQKPSDYLRVMPEPSTHPRGRVGALGRRVALRLRTGPWPARTALFFVLLTLVALVVVPVLVPRRVNELPADAEVVLAQHARAQVLAEQ